MVSRVQIQRIIFSYVLWQGLFFGAELKAEFIEGKIHAFTGAELAEESNSSTASDPSDSEENLGTNPDNERSLADEAQKETPSDIASPNNEDDSGDESDKNDDPVKEQFLRFHQFSLGLEFSRPKFSVTDLPLYKDYYGKESVMLGFRLDWDVLRNKYLALGFLFRLSHYSDSGFASQSSTNYVKDENAPVDITLIPLQLGVSLKLTPFSKKWLVINGWIGMERLFFQETRGSNVDDTTTAKPSTTTTATTSSNQDEVDSGVLTNKGWAQHIFTGLSLNILLNPLEEQPVKAASFLGIERVYLSPYFETSVPSQNKDRSGVKFKRTTYGVAFIFETRGI